MVEEHSRGLRHALASRHVSMIAIGGIIGAGLFVGSSTSIAQVGPGVIVSYGIAGIIILMVMRMLSEMAMLRPDAGSFTELVREGLGDRAGFVCGWLYWYFWVIVVAIEAIAGAVIIAGWTGLPVWAIGIALLALMTGVNLLSTRSYGEFEFWLSLIKVVAILGFIAIAGAWATGLTAPAGPTFATLTAHGGFVPHGWGAVLAGVTSVIFALCGAEIATIAAAESREPARVIARMTGSVALRILLFYLLSILLIVSILPWDAIVPGKSPFAAAMNAMHIAHAGDIMTMVVLVAVLSCLNSGMYVTSRVLFALSRRGCALRAGGAQWPRGAAALDADRQPVCLSGAGCLHRLAATGVQLSGQCLGGDHAVRLSDGLFCPVEPAPSHSGLRRADRDRHVVPSLWQLCHGGGHRGCPGGDGASARPSGRTGQQPCPAGHGFCPVLHHRLPGSGRCGAQAGFPRRMNVKSASRQACLLASTLLSALLSPMPVRAAEHADLLLFNGQVVTMDTDHPDASAVAVRDGKIVAVGGSDLATQFDAARKVDLKGRMLIPGFIDTHVHIIGQSRRSIALENAGSIAEIQTMLRAKARELGPGNGSPAMAGTRRSWPIIAI
jgi:L-asparagine transporter-like permease